MEFLLVPGCSGMTDEELIRQFLKFRSQEYPDQYDDYKEEDGEPLHDRGGAIYKKVPRDAINYMDIDSYYGITDTIRGQEDRVTKEVTNKYKIEKIREIIVNGGRNADLSEESLLSSAEKRVRRGPGLLCDFAIEHDYGIKIFE